MSDFGEEAWEEGFSDEVEYLEHLCDEAVSDFLRNEDDPDNPTIEELIKNQSDDHKDYRFSIRKGENGLLAYGLNPGELLTDFIFEEADVCFDNRPLTKVKKNGKYQLLKNLNVVVFEADYIGDCSYRFVKIRNNDKWGLYDQIEMVHSDIIFDEVGDFIYDKQSPHNSYDVFQLGLLSVKKDEFWGFIDVNFKEVIPCQYQDFKDFIYIRIDRRYSM